MQIRIKVELFGDNGKVTTDSNVEKAVAEGIVVGGLTLPKGKVISVRMPNILDAVTAQIKADTNAD